MTWSEEIVQKVLGKGKYQNRKGERTKLFISWFILFMLCPLLLIAQTPDTLWTKTFGGALNETGISVTQTIPDYGYIIAGYTKSFSGYAREAYFIKTDAAGETLWTNKMNWYTTALSVVQTEDSGYVATGNYYYDAYASLRIWKLDASGNLDWKKSYSLDERTYGSEIQQLTDGGYIVTGTVYDTAGYSNAILLRTDSLGDTSWTKRYAPGSVGRSVDQTLDGGYVMTGYTPAQAYFAVLLLKVDSLGDTLWSKCYGGDFWDEGHCVRQTSDSGYVIAGQWGQSSTDQDVYIIKTDELGDTMWTRHYNGGAWDRAESIVETNDGAYIATGRKWQPGHQADVWLLKVNAIGDTTWTACYGSDSSDGAYWVSNTVDGGYAVVGYTRSFGVGESDIWLLRIDTDTLGIANENSDPVVGLNPFVTIFSGPIRLPEGKKCKVYDITGRSVNPQNLKSGVYFIEMDGIIASKVVKLR